MQLEQVAHFNDLSEQLRNELTKKILGFGKVVRYKFDISNQNPDPTKHDGPVIWPNVYTLDPTVFNITDPYEKREKVSKSKRIALIEGVDEKGLPNRFKKLRIHGRHKGILTLAIEENNDHFYLAMWLELHPKLVGGKFSNKDMKQVVTRIDEVAHSKQQREERTARVKAMNAAQEMSDQDRVNFADAMQWDSTQDSEVLGNLIEQLAETDPVFFNDLVNGKNLEYQAAVKQALDRQIIGFDPAEWKIFWHSNQQPITVLSPDGDKSHVQKLAEWFQIGGEKATASYNRIKELLK